MAVPEQIPTTAVIGASGATGQECVKKLLELTNHAIIAIARDTEKAKAVLPANDRITVVEGDVSKSFTIRKALSGCNFIIFAATSTTYWGPECIDYKGVMAVARAAEELQVTRMVLISSMLVSPHNRWHPARIMLNNVRYSLMDFKFEGEQAVRKANLSYTIVRPGALTNAPTDRMVVAGQGDNGAVKGNLSRSELATVCVSALTHPGADRVTLEVVGGAPLEEGQTLGSLVKNIWTDIKQPDAKPEDNSPKWVSDLDAVVKAETAAGKPASKAAPMIVTIDCGAPDPSLVDDEEGNYRCSGTS